MYLSIERLRPIQVCVVFHEPRHYLVVVGFTVRQALPLVMAMSEKRFLTLGTNKMLEEIALVILGSPCFIYTVKQNPS